MKYFHPLTALASQKSKSLKLISYSINPGLPHSKWGYFISITYLDSQSLPSWLQPWTPLLPLSPTPWLSSWVKSSHMTGRIVSNVQLKSTVNLNLYMWQSFKYTILTALGNWQNHSNCTSSKSLQQLQKIPFSLIFKDWI